ncbi:hypothetical protein PHYC_00506 [Phycisphaerales bacterium]|nr:hypothetical protein PHYC_00506 [Phycisphaerales bacterium]
MTEKAHSPTPDSPIALAGVLLMLAAAAVKSLTTYDPFPAWSGDPLSIPAPVIGLTPFGGLIADAALALGATIAALGAAISGRATSACWGLLLVPGVVVLALHSRPAQPNALDNLLTAASWTSAIFAGWAATLAGQEARCRRMLAAGLLGLVGLWVLKGAAQVFIEHPETLRAFREDKAAFLQSHGWSEDSPMARAYERRLDQAEASGWFGMANVYASVMAASLAAMVGLLVSWMLNRRGVWTVNLDPAAKSPRAPADGNAMPLVAAALCVVGAISACGGIWLAGAKGGFAGALLGLALIALVVLTIRAQTIPSAIGWVLRRAPAQKWLGVLIGVGIPLGILGVVAIRGAIGTSSRELSVLFRWFYDLASWRIFTAHPWIGVGPAGFKDAYMLAKPAISPEDVSSPHSLLFDWSTTLGIAGAAWGIVWLAWLARAGRALLLPAAEPSPPTSPLRRETLWTGLVLAVAVVVATRLEIEIATPDLAVVRLGGLVLAAALASGVLVILRPWTDRAARAVNAALAATAIVLSAHCQFELTGTSPGAIPWVMLATGVAAAGFVCRRPAPRRSVAAAIALLPVCSLAALFVVGDAPRVIRWESNLLRAHDAVSPLGEFEVRLRILSRGPTRGDSAEQLRKDLLEELRRDRTTPPPGLDRGEFGRAVLALRVSRSAEAIRRLHAACEAAPSHAPTLQALTRMMMAQAEHMKVLADAAASNSMSADAFRVASEFADRYPSASAWAWTGTIGDGRAQLVGDIQLLTVALPGWQRASELAPHAVVYPVSLARAYARLGDREQASGWAQRALENDAKTVLDPLQGLSDAARSEMRALLAPGTR